MPPVSYTSVKIVHEQIVQEALERRRFLAGSEKPQRRLLQTFGTFLARLMNRPAQKLSATLLDGHRGLGQQRFLSRNEDASRAHQRCNEL